MSSTFQLTGDDAAAYAKLPLHHLRVLSAFEKGGTYASIANDLGIPIGTVRSRLHRARAKIIAARPASSEAE